MTEQNATYEQITPAYLGWGNAERDTANVRLYATDKDDSPRWANDVGGRVAEYALVERDGQAEGDRYLIVRVGDRFTKAERIEALREQIAALLAADDA